MSTAATRSVGVYPLGWAYATPRHAGGAMILGYATLSEAGDPRGHHYAFAEAREASASSPPTGEHIAALMTSPGG